MADKYDFPLVRQAILSIVRHRLEDKELVQKDYNGLRSDLPELPGQIA